MSNATYAVPERIIELDRPRKVVFDLNAFCMLEEAIETRKKAQHHAEQMAMLAVNKDYTYVPFTEKVRLFVEIDFVNPGLRDLRMMLWGTLLTDDPTLTLTKLNEIVTLESLEKLQPVLLELLGRAVPPAEKKPEGEETTQEGEAEKN